MINEIFKIIGLILCATALIVLLRQYSMTYALVVSTAACIVILNLFVKMCVPILDYAREIIALTGSSEFEYIIKAIGVALIAQTSADICADNGQRALAGKIIILGKVGIITVCLPLFGQLLSIMRGLLL